VRYLRLAVLIGALVVEVIGAAALIRVFWILS
jgi:hypothetical protein